MALLTDVDVGLDPGTARRLATAHPLDYLARQVFAWRRELTKGTVDGTGALLSRIKRQFGAVITDADRESSLWRRHMAEDEDGLEERRRKYLPDDYPQIVG